MNKYFLYARKSSEAEERQIMSIEAQFAELKEFAAKEKLEIVASFEEAKTAKEPGRTVFGEMLDRIAAGEASGILAWHPDRLARNSVDGGRIIYMVDTGKIHFLKFPTFWFENTPQGKFMLSIAFGQSKYYVDNLSENVKRGIRQKLRNGVWPGKATFGYTNDLRTHNIIPDSGKHTLAKRIFELYATGDHALEDIAVTLDLRTKYGKLLTPAEVQRILKNPFYYGVFLFKGELYEATHEPAITKKLFDEVQAVMASRGKRHKKKNHTFAFTGLMNCGTCGRAITAETQKGHIYYRCTKKRTNCDEKYVRGDALLIQFRDMLKKVSLSDDWAEQMLTKLDKEKADETQSSIALVHSLEEQIRALQQKLDTLLDSHLEGIVNKTEYITKKEKLLHKKIDLEGEVREIQNKGNSWLEPMRKFILDSNQAKKIADEGDLMAIRAFLKKIGSNFLLKDKTCVCVANIGWRVLAENHPFTELQARPESN